jgi:hypothetical protein
MDVDSANMCYVIRNTFTYERVYVINKDLLDPDVESPKDSMNRFLWIDKDTIKIINREGIEKTIFMPENFKEIEFNVIPLFNN